jgi:hypothetical protein
MEPTRTFLTAAEELAKRRKAKIADKKTRYSIHPRNGWVLIRMIPLQDELHGDVLVDKSQARTLRAEVVEASTKHDGSPTDLQPGDIVIVSAFPLEIEDLEEMTGERNLVMLRDEEIYSRCVPIEE